MGLIDKDYLKDLKDLSDTIPVERWRWRKREPDPWPDPWPILIFERSLVELASHIEAIEGFLEAGDLTAGRAFVRPQERPAVGNEALSQGLQAIEQRIQKIESSLAERGQVAKK